jgi:myo-inositol catabolism protein IolC
VGLGYDGNLYFLAFDHRGAFYRQLFGLGDEPGSRDLERVADAKRVILEGALRVLDSAPAMPRELGILVDEQSGADIAAHAKERGLLVAMPVERSGREVFELNYGERFGDHIERCDPDFAKVLVRHNPEGDAGGNVVQLERLKRLADWLQERDRRFLLELLVPATAEQLTSVGEEQDRYRAELRPGLTARAIAQIQDFGIEVDVWKLEGVERRSDAEILAGQARAGDGRDGVVCILLGAGESAGTVEHWLREAMPVDGFVGFAIGRSAWWEPLRRYLDGAIDRASAAQLIADRYARFIAVCRELTAAA